MSLVNSHNEWDTLREVIVGSGIPENLPAIDFTFKLHFHDNIHGKRVGEPNQEYITKKMVHEHSVDIENFVTLLKSLGIRVKRPEVPETIERTKTLCWESSTHPSLNCRDMCMVVGDMIIESPPTCRWRYFENDYLKKIFLQYFKQGARWISSPKPLLTDSSFDINFFKHSHPDVYDQYHRQASGHSLDCGHEILFDAANCMRMGTHILMNVSNENQRLGAQWLRDILGKKYTVMECNICDNHIDSEFLPIRPGLALVTLPELKTKLPQQLQSWDMIHVPEIYDTMYKYKNVTTSPLASPKIDYNILSIAPDALICSPECERVLGKVLKKYKIDVIPSRMRHADIFAGGHHCITIDTIRDGDLENYF